MKNKYTYIDTKYVPPSLDSLPTGTVLKTPQNSRKCHSKLPNPDCKYQIRVISLGVSLHWDSNKVNKGHKLIQNTCY